MDGTISVIIPVHNGEAFIRAAIDSALAQTVPPDEIIIVDDASDDDTVAVVTARADECIRVVRLPRRSGAQAARNAGIREAKGAWIAFLDADDTWMPRKLERQMQALAALGFDPWTLVYTNAVKVDLARGTQTDPRVVAIEGDRPYGKALQRSGPLFPSIVVSKTALAAIAYLDERVPAFQEWDTSIRLAKHCRFVYIPEPLFVYYRPSGATISTDVGRAIEGYRYITDKFEQDIRSMCGEAAWREHLLVRAQMALDGALWSRADDDLRRLPRRGTRYWFLRFCRFFHVSPSRILRLKNIVRRGKLQRELR